VRANQIGWGRVIFTLFSVACLFAPRSAPLADDDYTPVYHPALVISRGAGEIEVDGDLGDPGWRGAAVAENFAEHNPGDQTKPAVDTRVMITYDDANLYVAWMCYDEPGEVRATFCERDKIFSDDYVILCLDTYGDATLAYELAANPYGIPGDLLFSSAYGEDITYDMIYETAGRVTEFGWVVEMAIPFMRLRFPEREEQSWRVDFWRNRPRESRYQYSWAAYNRDEDCWPCQWGTVTGLAGIKPGRGLDILPGVIAHQSGALDGNGDFASGVTKGDMSLGVAYDITSELKAEATINPDFSQVEADAAQIDVNTTFALFYPEKRPFFQEGSDLFNTYFDAVYTRSINDPMLAGKMTLRKGSNSVAFLSASDENSVIILPFEESSRFVANGKSFSNILRARHDLGEQSHLGLIATDRRFESGGAGSLAGIDGKIRFATSNAFLFQVMATRTEEVFAPELTDSAFNETRFDENKYTAALDGETFNGHAFYTSINRNAANYWFGGEYRERSPTFRADNGFEPSNNVRYGGAWLGGILRFEDSGVLENINGDMSVGREWNFEGIQKDEWINTNLQVCFRSAQTYIHTNYMSSNELFGGIQFVNIWQGHICFSTQPGGALQFGGYYNYGHRIARWQLVMGKETTRGLWADVKPIDRLLISLSYDDAFSDDLKTDAELFSQAIFRTRMSLQLSRELSARLVLQYNDRYNSWDIDPLITYRINSLSVFYIGSTQNYRDMNPLEDGRDGWMLTNRQYFLKFQYLIRL
jgi:hypothetical protein